MRPFAISLTVLTLFSTTACSQGQEESTDDLRTFDVAEEAAPPAPPGVGPTAAPGVAFTYRYGFRMPDANISTAQEAHAAACEKLGLTRCRITDMTYSLDGRERVQASLALSIDPLIARAFGRDAGALVTRLDGRVNYTKISGEDQNLALDDAARRQSGATTGIAQLEADLAKARSENERAQLREQIRQLQADALAARSAAAQSEAKIQRTPMTFAYVGGGASGRGFAGENPVREAWYLFVDSLATMVGFALKGLAVILPWLLLFAALVAIARSRLTAPLRRWWAGAQGSSTEE